jgi:cytochrome c oxidase cbb3-type subunit III
MDIFRIIKDGTPEDSEGHNGARMLAYGNLLPPTEIAAVTAYILAQNAEEFGVPAQ